MMAKKILRFLDRCSLWSATGTVLVCVALVLLTLPVSMFVVIWLRDARVNGEYP